jgi:hypothetical protein
VIVEIHTGQLSINHVVHTHKCPEILIISVRNRIFHEKARGHTSEVLHCEDRPCCPCLAKDNDHTVLLYALSERCLLALNVLSVKIFREHHE